MTPIRDDESALATIGELAKAISKCSPRESTIETRNNIRQLGIVIQDVSISVAGVMSENQTLKSRVTTLESENASLKSRVDAIESENAELKANMDAAWACISALHALYEKKNKS